ncbi:hypothetical protein [Treponema sp.]|uniref:hypothetical protein n=1 Tax=Treponema sp. TaxID=166 RepID=UPI00257C03BB|nr:hypothetical protein [Treponema sp.]
MDDDEYYEKMRRHNLNQDMSWLPKKNKKPEYSKWRVHEGHEDAEMLVEKNTPDEEDEK